MKKSANFASPRKMRTYQKTAGRRKRRGIISLEYPYILNVGNLASLGPITRKFNFSDISFLGGKIS